MAVEETKHDLLLKRAQITIGILAALTTLIIGAYNVKKTLFAPTGPGTISVRVVSVAGGGLQGAHLEFLSGNAVVSAGEVDSQGNFSRDGFDAGEYAVKARRSGFETETVMVRVNPRKTTDVEISLRPLPSAAPQQAAPGSPLRSALEEAGASWIKKIGTAKEEAAK
jgi:hypothetical protein